MPWKRISKKLQHLPTVKGAVNAVLEKWVAKQKDKYNEIITLVEKSSSPLLAICGQQNRIPKADLCQFAVEYEFSSALYYQSGIDKFGILSNPAD